MIILEIHFTKLQPKFLQLINRHTIIKLFKEYNIYSYIIKVDRLPSMILL